MTLRKDSMQNGEVEYRFFHAQLTTPSQQHTARTRSPLHTTTNYRAKNSILYDSFLLTNNNQFSFTKSSQSASLLTFLFHPSRDRGQQLMNNVHPKTSVETNERCYPGGQIS